MCVCVWVNKEFIRAITRLEVSESKAQVDDRPFNGVVARYPPRRDTVLIDINIRSSLRNRGTLA